MPPKKQKAPRNAFFYFMEEFREREETQGRFYNSMAEVASAAGPEWQAMSLEQRKPYEMMKTEQKSKKKEKKYNALGEEVSLAKKREEEEERGKRAMQKYIENLVVDGNDFTKKMFYIAHVNHYCYCTAQNRHIPAEISIVRFSLKDGICLEDCYNVILDVGNMPIGYRLAAVTVSEETHNIPVPPHDDEVGQFSEKNIRKAFVSMTEFLRKNLGPRDHLPPVYVDDLNIEMAKDVFKHLHDEYDGGNPYNEFTVYSLSYLFFVLRNAAHAKVTGEKAFPFPTIPQAELEKDVYDYVKGIACKFHDTNDCAYQHCSLSKAIRKAFIICDHTCYDLDIDLIPGRHVPMNSKSTKLEQRPSSQNDWVTISRNNSRPQSSLSNGVRNHNSEAVPGPVSRPSSHTLNNNPEPPRNRERGADFEEAREALASLPTRAPEPTPTSAWGLRKPQSRSMAMSIQPQQPPNMENDFPALGVSKPRTAPLGRGRGRMLQQ